MTEYSRGNIPFTKRIGAGLAGIPGSLWGGIRAAGRGLVSAVRGIGRQIKLLFDALRFGDALTRLSFVFMGAGCLFRGQWLSGLLYLAAEAGYIGYMVTTGGTLLRRYLTLGETLRGEVWDEEEQIWVYTQPDNSLRILLFGTVTVLLTLGMLWLYAANVRAAFDNQRKRERGVPVPTVRQQLEELADTRFQRLTLSVPAALLTVFTILPLLFMMLMAFTNFDKAHQPPGNLFTWTGWETFRNLFGGNALISTTFFRLLGWTLVWAFFATFTNYFFGIILALLINRKGIRFKSLWRTVFVMTIAVPQFVSLLLMSQLLSEQGAVNVLLQNIGLIQEALPFLTDAAWARVTVIVVNMWVGIPYTLLISTGILMNIPEDLYESARIDGAGPAAVFFRITMPYMFFVTAPYLITQFVGNINNFNLIYLLTGGGPLSLDYYQAGKTDLLVTWLYKQTVNEQNYNLASAIGILVFLLSAAMSLLVYARSSSAQREEEFQ